MPPGLSSLEVGPTFLQALLKAIGLPHPFAMSSDAWTQLQVPTSLLPAAGFPVPDAVVIAEPSALWEVQPLLGDHPQQRSGCSTAGKELAGQVRRHTSIFPWLSHPMPPVNMSLSDEKVNKFSSRLKVSIISFVSDK